MFDWTYVISAGLLSIGSVALLVEIGKRKRLAKAAPSQNPAKSRTAVEEMQRLSTSLAIPLISQGELLGYILLDSKQSGGTYSGEDIRLLRIVANQAALAYQRVRYMDLAIRGARTDMLGEIAGGFAHEIKTPLANISLSAELSYIDLASLETRQRSSEETLPELKQRMKDIMDQTVKASEKIEAIRQFSKPGQVPLGPVDIATVISGSRSLLDHLVNKSGADIRVQIPAGIPLLRGNPKQLEIVFVNLIKNAIEAMQANAPAGTAKLLQITVREDGAWIEVRVKDSGPGIRKTDIHHLFEAYFTTKGTSGTGVGLFLSQQVIKAHGGQIDVSSEEGQGTEFCIRLPKFSSKDEPNTSGVAESTASVRAL
jgi:two-component system, NtrC family, sensor kinase